MKKGLLVFFLIFIQSSLDAKSFYWSDLEKGVTFRWDFDTNFLANKNFNQKEWNRIGKFTMKDEILKEEMPDKMELIEAGDRFFLIVDGTGLVYELSNDFLNFNRIDYTVFRGYNHESLTFWDGKELKNIGGLHDGIYNLVLTFFDFSKNEWEAIVYNGEYPLSIQEGFTQYNPAENSLYVFDIFKNDQYYQTYDKKEFHFFKLNLKDANWEDLGVLNKDLFTPGHDFKNWEKVWIGDYFFIQNNNGKRYLMDISSNKIYEIDLDFPINKNSKIGKTDNEFLFFQFDADYNLTDKLVIPMNLLLNNKNYLSKVYDSKLIEFKFIYLIYLVEIVLFLLILFQVYQLSKLYLGKGSKKVPIGEDIVVNENILNFLKDLKSNQEKAFYTTSELNEIINCSNKAFDTQRQYRSRFINELESFIEAKFGLTGAIIRVQDLEDKRCVNYQIHSDLVNNSSFKKYLEELDEF